MKLNELDINKKGIIKNVLATDNIRRRLMDIGFNKGVEIEPILEGKSMRAYKVKGSIIAVRKEDTSKIEVDIWN